MGNFNKMLFGVINNNDDSIIALVALSLFIVGIMFIYPSQQSKESAKLALPFILLGCAICLSAVAIAHKLASGF